MSTHYLSRFPGPKESQKATNTRLEIQVAAGMIVVILWHGFSAMLFIRAWIPSLNFAPQHGTGIGVYLEFLWDGYMEWFTCIGKFNGNVSIVFLVGIELIDCSGWFFQEVSGWSRFCFSPTMDRNFCFKFQKISFQLETRRWECQNQMLSITCFFSKHWQEAPNPKWQFLLLSFSSVNPWTKGTHYRSYGWVGVNPRLVH